MPRDPCNDVAFWPCQPNRFVGDDHYDYVADECLFFYDDFKRSNPSRLWTQRNTAGGSIVYPMTKWSIDLEDAVQRLYSAGVDGFNELTLNFATQFLPPGPSNRHKLWVKSEGSYWLSNYYTGGSAEYVKLDHANSEITYVKGSYSAGPHPVSLTDSDYHEIEWVSFNGANESPAIFSHYKLFIDGEQVGGFLTSSPHRHIRLNANDGPVWLDRYEVWAECNACETAASSDIWFDFGRGLADYYLTSSGHGDSSLNGSFTLEYTTNAGGSGNPGWQTSDGKFVMRMFSGSVFNSGSSATLVLHWSPHSYSTNYQGVDAFHGDPNMDFSKGAMTMTVSDTP